MGADAKPLVAFGGSWLLVVAVFLSVVGWGYYAITIRNFFQKKDEGPSGAESGGMRSGSAKGSGAEAISQLSDQPPVADCSLRTATTP